MEWILSAADRSLLGAVCRNDAVAVQRALRHGANVNVVRWQDEKYNYTTPLFKACYCGYNEIVRILLDAGANARWTDYYEHSVSGHACWGGHLSIVEMLLNHDKDLLEAANDYGNTPLLLAISLQHFDIVCFLLDRGANVHATTQDGQTALMRACYESNLEIVRLLLAASVDVDARDEVQETALHYAAKTGRMEAMRELALEHNANMSAKDQDGKTPFDWMVLDYANVEQYLIIYSNKMTQDHGRLALHSILGAAEYAYVENEEFHPPLKPLLQICLPLGKLTLNHFRFLLTTLDTNVMRTRDENGKVPFHIAIQNKAPVEVLSMFVEIDAATLHIADHAGALPLHECYCGVVDYSSVRFLVEQGGVGTLATRTREGALPLHILCGSKNPLLRNVQYMVQSFPGAVTARTNAGQYSFMIAACESSTASLSVVYVLVRASPDLVILN